MLRVTVGICCCGPKLRFRLTKLVIERVKPYKDAFNNYCFLLCIFDISSFRDLAVILKKKKKKKEKNKKKTEEAYIGQGVTSRSMPSH